MRRALLLLAPLVAVGLIGAVVSAIARESDTAFVFRQEHPSQATPLELETLIAKAREPIAGGHGSRTRSVDCKPGSPSGRRNPWSCRVHYASGRITVYRVEIDPRGAFAGVDRTGERVINGCCVADGRAPSG